MRLAICSAQILPEMCMTLRRLGGGVRQLSTCTASRRTTTGGFVDEHQRKHTYLRFSLTERCNLRCLYCMPEEGVQLSPPNHLLTTSELVKLARIFVERGTTKIRLTGGEPTLRKDLLDIIAGLNALRPLGLKTIGLTTNGIVLKRYVTQLKALGLDQVNISLDTLDEFKFQLLTRRNGLELVMSAIDHCLDAGLETKLNVVVLRDVNMNELGEFVKLTRTAPLYVRFIEYMPFEGNRWTNGKFVPYSEMLETLKGSFGRLEKLCDPAHDTSKAYQVRDFVGKFGFITSMSEHFCGSCNRLRVMADGNLKVCLFGNAEVNLRDAMRRGESNETLVSIIQSAGVTALFSLAFK